MASKLTDIFAIDVFNENVMADYLPKNAFKAFKKTIETGDDLEASVADAIANAMKNWAVERGATHYTHWFQPMTGITAEKHDSFISPTSDGKVIMEFSGKELIKGEPDASSFPSGGLRATFEARGYTAWDCTSPAFLREDATGVTLCIPTAFCSYTGEALDKKTPLLRSMEVLSKEATRLLNILGNDDVTKVTCSVGAEQEYFIIDKAKYLKREDIIFSGRTLFGAMPPKGQELEDHYFGCIKERVGAFMQELNEECWKLGILAKTQHNEVAPAQHELAPIYATANIATDHNQLVMECMKKVASRHGLTCLLHEKPFAGVNGSGKHDNWSMVTNTGKNLLDPGKTPHENIQFLLFLSAILKAVDTHAGLLRLSASNAGNDHRLGANEAPPAIISIFVGDQLGDVLTQLIETGEAKSSKQGEKLRTGVHTIPAFRKDATDRNRTSPFAFTGNKFEFRMLGSSMSVSEPNTVLNTIVADVLSQFANEIEKSDDVDLAVHDIIKRTVAEHQRIIFNGNGYSEEWVEEAERRGLPNFKSIVDAIENLVSEQTVDLFTKHHVYSETELHSRAEIEYENYSKIINIEAKTMLEMTNKLYVPAVSKFMKQVAESVNEIRKVSTAIDTSVQENLLVEISSLLTGVDRAKTKLTSLVAEASKLEGKEQAKFFRYSVFVEMAELRSYVDSLEVIVDKEAWPVPTYGDILFEV